MFFGKVNEFCLLLTNLDYQIINKCFVEIKKRSEQLWLYNSKPFFLGCLMNTQNEFEWKHVKLIISFPFSVSVKFYECVLHFKFIPGLFPMVLNLMLPFTIFSRLSILNTKQMLNKKMYIVFYQVRHKFPLPL